jgi:hypothetical protein
MHFQRLNSPPTVRLDHTANCLGHCGCTAQAVKFSGKSTPVPAILIHRRRKISAQVPKHSYHYVTFVSSLIPPSTHTLRFINHYTSQRHIFSSRTLRAARFTTITFTYLSVHRYGKTGPQAAPYQCFEFVEMCSLANHSSYSFNSSHLT